MRSAFLKDHSGGRRENVLMVRLEEGEELGGYCNGPLVCSSIHSTCVFVLFCMLCFASTYIFEHLQKSERWGSMDRLKNVKGGEVQSKGKHLG